MAIVEQTARQELADVTGRIEELTRQVEELDERLLTCGTHEGARLIRSRRDAIDETNWLQGRLPVLRDAAKQEAWQERRSELNAAWTALVERQLEASREFRECVEKLLTLIPPMLGTHAEQVELLRQYLHMDKLLPPDPPGTWFMGRNPSAIQQRLNDLNRRPRPQLQWLLVQLQSYLPDVGQRRSVELYGTGIRSDAELIDGRAIEFRQEVL